MATAFPAAIDALSNPLATDTLSAVSHSAQHANANDAIEAIETRIGTTAAPNLAVLAGVPGGQTLNGGTAASETLTLKSTTHATQGQINYTASKHAFSGDIAVDKTVTASGTTGAQTINKTSGSVNFAAGATSLVVTNSRVSASSIIMLTVASNDAALRSVWCVAGAGSFTIYGNAAASAETRVNFIVIN